MADLVFTILGIDRGSPAFEKVAKSVDRAAERLQNLGSVSIKTLGGVAAAGTASSVLIGGAMAGTSLAFLGMAVAAQASNQRVQASFAALGGGVRTEITAMTAHIGPELEAVAGKLTTTFGQLKPLLATAFSAVGPQLRLLTDGVSAFALGAMPGMVRSVQRAGPVFEGLRDLLADVGSGVSGFFDELSQGSAGAGTVLSGLDTLLRGILPAAGALIRQLSDAASGSFGAISGAVLGAVQVFGQLSGGALPVLTVALTAAASVLQGITSVLSPFAGILGSVTGAILAGAAAWKVWTAASDGIATLVGGIDRVRTKMAGATAGATGFAGRLRGLAGLMGGPLGLAITGVTLGLGFLGGAQESSAEAAARHAGFTQTLSAALRESGGVIDANVRKQVAGNEGTAEAIKQARELGIASAQVVDAVTGQGTALQDLRTKLEQVAEAEKIMQHSARTGLDTWTGSYTERGNSARTLLTELDALASKTQEQLQAEKDYAAATKQVGRSLLDSSGAGKQLREAIKTLSDEMATGEEKAKGLLAALDALTGADISLEQSTAKVHEGLAKLGEMFDQSVNKADGWGAALITQDGHVNTATKNGRGLLEVMTGLRDNTAQAAQKTYDLAIAQGESVPVAMDKARKVVEDSRQGLVKQAAQLGLTKDQAEALATQYDLVPELIETVIQTPGLSDAQREVMALSTKIGAVPPGKKVKIDALSQEAQRMVEFLGATVTRLPDGKVEVTANTREAHRQIGNIPLALRGTVTYTTIYRSGSGVSNVDPYRNDPRFRARGGPVLAGNTYVVGEEGPELFTASQSGYVITAQDTKAILAGIDSGQALRGRAQLGTPLNARGGGGGWQVTININGATDPVRAAEEVRRSLLRLRRELGGGGLGFD